RVLNVDPANLQARYTLAECFLKKNDTKNAIEELGKILSQNRDFAPGHNLLGVAYAQSGNTQAAIEQFQRALELDPGLSDAHDNLSLALRAKR
ncbi:MAG TPA: tetratricopeptide repeat protein, partial [Blastocatellia bacterium]|nr:tetratricopeptide repeat protein [Blastocatellia bacterium]